MRGDEAREIEEKRYRDDDRKYREEPARKEERNASA
jgi:hypothetical protein